MPDIREISAESAGRSDAAAWRARGRQTYEAVMAVPTTSAPSPCSESGLLDFVFADIWNRPILSRRDRRWITLACVSAADTVGPIEAHVYAADEIPVTSRSRRCKSSCFTSPSTAAGPRRRSSTRPVWKQKVAINAERR